MNFVLALRSIVPVLVVGYNKIACHFTMISIHPDGYDVVYKINIPPHIN
jgi:hypothetical protein